MPIPENSGIGSRRLIFQAAVQPIYENLKTSNPTTYAVVEEIRAMA